MDTSRLARGTFLSLVVVLQLAVVAPAYGVSIAKVFVGANVERDDGFPGEIDNGEVSRGGVTRHVDVFGGSRGVDNRAEAEATADLRGGRLHARAVTQNHGFAGAEAQIEQTTTWTNESSELGRISFLFVINGSLHNPSLAQWTSSVSGGVGGSPGAAIALPGGRTVVTMFTFIPGLVEHFPLDVLMLFTLSASEGGSADFFRTATLYIQLPESVIFEGSESGDFLADRTDAFLRPGELPPDATVPEPSALLLISLGSIGVLMKFAKFPNRRRRTVNMQGAAVS